MEKKSLKGTQTEKNLLASFAGEAQARNRYTLWAEVARKEGYQQIANIFMETAENEFHHAKRFFSFLEGGEVEITAAYPAGSIKSTLENLKEAAAGEHEEGFDMYPGFAAVAKEEGFPQIAAVFNVIAQVEHHHEMRYRKLAENIEKGLVFKKEQPTQWKCLACGYVHEGTEAPKVCPSCLEKQEQFELLAENY
ncbi:MAG: rubrerythrin [Cetobacterium sp.]